jgi:hypothetical protein
MKLFYCKSARFLNLVFLFQQRDTQFIQSIVFHETSPDILLKASINKYLFNVQTKKSVQINFEKFVKFVLYEIKSNVISYGSYHWMPFTNYCGLCDVDFDFVGKLETLESDVQGLSTQFPEIFDQEILKIFRSKQNSSPGTSERTTRYAFSKLSKTLIKDLYNVYESDFLVGGYPYPEEYIKLGRSS